MDSDNLIRPPFTKKYLDKEKEEEKGKVFTIRMNEKEYQELQVLKETLHIDSDSTCLKVGFTAGKNVLQTTFTYDFLKWLCDGKRKRDY